MRSFVFLCQQVGSPNGNKERSQIAVSLALLFNQRPQLFLVQLPNDVEGKPAKAILP